MIPPSNCPYKGLSAPPCWSCQWHNADMDTCNLQLTVRTASDTALSAVTSSQSYEERMRQYEIDRQKLLELSKEALVDLILHRPTLF